MTGVGAQFDPSRLSSPEMRRLGLALLLVAAVVFAYQPVWHAGFIWDDSAHVTSPGLRSLAGLARIWTQLGATQQYYPLVHSVFWVEHRLWGDAALGYHLVNLLLHALSALMLARILGRLKIPGAWLAAAIFALHPVQVETVAWISEQKNTLSGVCYLGAALAYLGFDRDRKGGNYVLALVLFVLGLLSKTVIAPLPAALLVVFWWQRGKLSWKQDVRWLLPFFIVGIGAGLFTAWVERKFIGAEGSEFNYSLLERFLIAGRGLWFYLGKLFWPVDLVFIYPRWKVSQAVGWQYLFPAAMLLLLAALWWVRRWWRGPLAGLLFFGGTLFPALGFFNVLPFRFTFVCDHFQYLASIGPLALAAAGIMVALDFLQKEKLLLRVGFCGMLLLALGGLTWRQTTVYRNSETLWRDTLTKNPDSWMAHENFGVCLFKTGRVDEAVDHFRKSIELNPNGAAAHSDYGAVLQRSDKLDEGEREVRKALELEPNLVEPHINLAEILRKRGELNEAVEEYKTILQLVPPSEPGRIGLADALCLLGRPDEAIPYYREVLEANPTNADVRTKLGLALIELGDLAAAGSEFSSVLQADPRNAKAIDGLGYVLAMQGRLDEARVRFLEAMQLDPKGAYPHLHYAMCLSAQRQAREAMVEYRKALALDDQLSPACNNLAWMLAVHPDPQIRNGKEAVELAERACRLTNDEQPFYLGTLAAAYAEAGRFSDAIATAEKARDLARKAGLEKVAERNEQLLELYRAGRPCHEPAEAAQ